MEASMTIEEQIQSYIDTQPIAKREELLRLHQLALRLAPEGPFWFNDGRNEEGKIVANPNIGYGCYTIRYADGTTREFFRIGLSANKTGISVYVLGLKDKTYLATTLGKRIGKASVTGYCIKFKSIADIDLGVLEEAITYGLRQPSDS